MATIERFEDIEAWKQARQMTRVVYELTRNGEFSRDFALKDQIRRACISVKSNIAEGFERGNTKEFLHFLGIAKGSIGEVRSQLYIARDAEIIDQTEYDNLVRTAADVGRRESIRRCDRRFRASL